MDLSEVRKDIDIVDKEMKELFKKRMGLAKKVAAIKAETHDNVYKPDREKAIIESLLENVEPDIKEEYKDFLVNLLKLRRRYQYRLLGMPEEE